MRLEGRVPFAKQPVPRLAVRQGVNPLKPCAHRRSGPEASPARASKTRRGHKKFRRPLQGAARQFLNRHTGRIRSLRHGFLLESRASCRLDAQRRPARPDHRLEQRVQLVVGGRTHLDEDWYAIGTAPANTVEHQAMQVDVEVGGPEALDQHDGAAVAFVGP